MIQNTTRLFIIFLFAWGSTNSMSAQETAVEILKGQAKDLLPVVESSFATQFLKAVEQLPELSEPRIVYYNRNTRDAFPKRKPENYRKKNLRTINGSSWENNFTITPCTEHRWRQ